MGRLIRIAQQLCSFTAPRRDKPPIVAISDSHAHYCEGCRCYVKITLWEMDTCPNCGAGVEQLKFAALWQRTPGEQAARSEARQRRGFVKALHGGTPLPQLAKPKTEPLPKRTIVRGDDAA